MRIVATSGYFDPLHVGHIELLKQAKLLGDQLWVIVNNDFQATLKKGAPFMPAIERGRIVGELKFVDKVIIAFDTDGTVCQTLAWIRPDIFAKGGDSVLYTLPERDICNQLGIEILTGVGGSKTQSSSELLSTWQARKV